MPMRIFTASLLCVLCCLPVVRGEDGDVPFRVHTINADSEFSAVAAIDVDQDGRLDIVSGGFWYQAPDWTQHKTRDVEVIRGRFDDYSNLPLDVDGDGWTDLVSVNYRSESLYWTKNPGPSLGDWKRFVIDTPGPSETGRLFDIDGDGRLDVLPDGTKFAAWYEVILDTSADGSPAEPRWVRHDLPDELIAHGHGFGDLNGDGRGDMIVPKGWAEAPEDPRCGQWIWHPEFSLHRDCGMPILVDDVDGDGDADLIWGRGHNVGLYWTEQLQDESGTRTWQTHAIDTSWSQPHSIMLADIDGDGRDDLVAGKRYMGHDGKDPGEFDPLVMYWYSFAADARTWHRHLISWGGYCGFDLDPKCVDIDADGDMDILAAARCGVYLVENLRIQTQDQTPSDDPRTLSSVMPPPPIYEDHRKLLVYRDEGGQLEPVATPWEWGIRRSHVLANMQRVMGTLPNPSRRVPLDVQVVEEEDAGKYIRSKITFAAEPGDRVPAYLLIPKGVSGSVPAMLCLHPTSPLGKSQICGLGGKPSRFYAHELAERGYVCLAPDYPSFGDYPYDFAADDYTSGTMKGIWNHIRAVDLLESLPAVRPDAIGCIGHSLGGHNALFAAAFDQRIRVIVTSCGFNAFEDYYEGDLTGWTSDRYMPAIREVYGSDPRQMPFDFPEIIAAMAPRPLFINAPKHDANFAVAGVEKCVESASHVYRLRGAADKLQVVYPDAEHDFPEDIRQMVYQWLDKQLKR